MIEIKVPDPSRRIQSSYQKAKQKGALRLNNCKLDKFPDEIHRFDTYSLPGDNWWEDVPLVQVDLSNNPLPSIDPRINQLLDLQVLHIHHANITEIPPTVFDIQQLKNLNLSFNQIQAIGRNVGNCKELRELSLHGN